MILIPNLITLLHLTSGVFSILFALRGDWVGASWLILLCSFLDGIDGKVAKWLKSESEFGQFFDSVSDFVGFGIAPAFIFVFSKTEHELGLAILAGLGYSASALFRLVRFNMAIKSSSDSDRAYFQGLPTTATAGFLVSFWILSSIHPKLEMFDFPVFISLAVLMSSQVRFYNPKYLFLNPHLGKWVVLMVCIALTAGFLSEQFIAFPLAMFGMYIVWGVFHHVKAEIDELIKSTAR